MTVANLHRLDLLCNRSHSVSVDNLTFVFMVIFIVAMACWILSLMLNRKGDNNAVH